MNDTTGLADGQVRFNGYEWQIVRNGGWVSVESPKHIPYEIKVEFHD